MQVEEQEATDDFKLPGLSNLVVVIVGNIVTQTSFFIIVSSVSLYTLHLGGDETFSGLVLGIPTLCGGLALFPLLAYDGGTYRAPMIISYSFLILGSLLYSLADLSSFLYLILLGRMSAGIGYTSWLYNKKYFSDSRIVGIRRRTLLSSWLVVGQGVGLSAGPFFGGLLYKVGFSNRVFNGYTSPGWLMVATFIALTIGSVVLFRDVKPYRHQQKTRSKSVLHLLTRFSNWWRQNGWCPRSSSPPSRDHPTIPPVIDDTRNTRPTSRPLTRGEKAVIATMMWFSMLNFFILGSWEANIPIFTKVLYGYSPYNAGNFIALGGLVTFPVLLLNVRYSRRFQDRVTLAVGAGLGLIGIILMMVLISISSMGISRGWYFVCWVLVAVGFNISSTCTLSLLSKQLPSEWNSKSSMLIQYSNYVGRVTGAVWGGAGLTVGQINWLALQLALVGLGMVMCVILWKKLKAKTG